MNHMLTWDPNKRLSTAKVLQHGYFEASALPDVTQPRSGLPGPGGIAADVLSSTKGSWAAGGGSHPSTGKRPSIGGKENSTGSNFNLPSLAQDTRKGSGTGSGAKPGSRYMRMARYQD